MSLVKFHLVFPTVDIKVFCNNTGLKFPHFWDPILVFGTSAKIVRKIFYLYKILRSFTGRRSLKLFKTSRKIWWQIFVQIDDHAADSTNSIAFFTCFSVSSYILAINFTESPAL